MSTSFRSLAFTTAAASFGLSCSCGESPSATGAVPESPPVEETWTPYTFEALARLEPLEEGGPLVYDEVAMIVLRPDLDMRMDWPEHPRGTLRMRTNERGFVETEPTSPDAAGFRILVTGDSHTQGVVWTEETYANQLERLLGDVDVVNAAVGRTGTRGYLGVLRKNLDLTPDLVLAGVFAGNDFSDAVRASHHLAGRPMVTDVPKSYWEPLALAKKVFPGPMAQGVNQAYRFKHYPEDVDRALALVEEELAAMAALCAANGARFAVVIVPTRRDVDLGHGREVYEVLERELGLTPDEAGIAVSLSARLAAALEQRGIPCFDPTEEMRAIEGPLYWSLDDHLALDGHTFFAEYLQRELTGAGLVE